MPLTHKMVTSDQSDQPLVVLQTTHWPSSINRLSVKLGRMIPVIG